MTSGVEDTLISVPKRTSQFTGSSGPVSYTLHEFNGVKLVFRLSLSLPRKIVMITFMHCKAVVRIKVG